MPTPLDNVPQISTERKDASFASFRPFWTQPNDTSVVVNIIPGQTRNLPFAPSTQKPEVDKIFQVVREMRDDGFNFFRFEESLTGISFRQSADMLQAIDPSSSFGQAKGLSEQLGFPVDGRRFASGIKAFFDVAAIRVSLRSTTRIRPNASLTRCIWARNWGRDFPSPRRLSENYGPLKFDLSEWPRIDDWQPPRVLVPPP